MWPDVADAIEDTVAVETALADAYAQALTVWAPRAEAAILPVVSGVFNGDPAAATREIPPHIEAMSHTQKEWEQAYLELVEPAVRNLWADAVLDTLIGLSIDGDLDPYSDAGEEFFAAFRHQALTVPGSVADDLTALLTAETEALTASLNDRLRGVVRDAIRPGSQLLGRQILKRSYQASSILNHAAVTVGKAHSSNRRHKDTEPAMRKQWVAILDDRTRDSHWQADGQTVELAGNFMVGGVEMEFPGDPKAPPREVVNCRCRLGVLQAGEKPSRRNPPKQEAKARRARGIRRNATVASASEEIEMTAAVTVNGAPKPEAETELYRTFTDAVVAFIGTPTSDKRKFAKNADLTYRSMPRPLMWMRHTGNGEGHSEAYTVGVIEQMRHDDEKVYASGYLLNTPEADDALTQLEHKVTRPSVDIGDMAWALTDEDDREINEEDWLSLPLDAKVFRTFNAAEFIGVTLVAKPAFGDTCLTLDSERHARADALTASVHEFKPKVYPAKMFADPQLSGPTLPQIDDDGRIFGHIACWNTPHRNFPGDFVTAPRSPSGYQHFHTSPSVRLDDGKLLPVGCLTLGTDHANPGVRVTGAAAMAHYANTGQRWALVRVGEDNHGIWFSGIPAPGATSEQVETGLSAPLSGDWRDFGQGLDLIAALSVNTPGFVTQGRDDEWGRPVTLVASLGPVPTNEETVQRGQTTMFDIKAAMKEALREQAFDGRMQAAFLRADEVAPEKTPNERAAELLNKAGL